MTTYLKYQGSGLLYSLGCNLRFFCLYLRLLIGPHDSTILAYTAFRTCELFDVLTGPLFRLKEQSLCQQETQRNWDQHIDQKVFYGECLLILCDRGSFHELRWCHLLL